MRLYSLPSVARQEIQYNENGINWLEEDVDDEPVADAADDPEDEEGDGEEVLVEGVDRGEGQPVRVGVLEDLLGSVEAVFGACQDGGEYY